MRAKIAVLAGDGVGQEVTPEGIRALEAVASRFGHDFQFEDGLIGTEAIERVGEPIPAETLSLCNRVDAVLMGAVGGPKWDRWPGRPTIRKLLDLSLNLRPIQVLDSLADCTPFKPERICGVDVLILREIVHGRGRYYGTDRSAPPPVAGYGASGARNKARGRGLSSNGFYPLERRRASA